MNKRPFDYMWFVVLRRPRARRDAGRPARGRGLPAPRARGAPRGASAVPVGLHAAGGRQGAGRRCTV